MSIRIVVGDDHATFRDALRLLLERAGFDVIGEAENGVALLDLARRVRPQLVVTDMSMPLMNGIDAAAAIRSELGIPAILLTMHSDLEYVLHAISAGLMGYVLKSTAIACLVDAIGQVSAGNVYLSPGVSGAVTLGMLTRGRPAGDRFCD